MLRTALAPARCFDFASCRRCGSALARWCAAATALLAVTGTACGTAAPAPSNSSPSAGAASEAAGTATSSGSRAGNAQAAAIGASAAEARGDGSPESAGGAGPSMAEKAPFVAEKVWGEDRAMGTHLAYTAFTTPTVDAESAKQTFATATAEIRRIELLMTTWRDDSEVSRINAAAGTGPVVVSQETFDIIQAAQETSELSHGAFDITFESLHGLWKFDQDMDPHPPPAADVRKLLPLVDYRRVRLDPVARSVFIEKPGVRISLGGIAKGYAVDRAARVLMDAGLTSFYVQAGGDLFTHGRKPDGSEWLAGIRDPRDPEKGYFAMLPVSDHAFSTAGDYERSYIVGGKRYHHIIDPHTGYPATACRSVTIWAPTALVADEIDDAVFILGPKKGLELVESKEGVGAVILDRKNNLWISKRLQGRLHVTRVPLDGI